MPEDLDAGDTVPATVIAAQIANTIKQDTLMLAQKVANSMHHF